MSRTWALLPKEYARGVRVVETTLRPAQPVCLIPEDSTDLAVKFVESRSLAWGGHASYVIPYSSSDGLSKRWKEVLELLDPDRVFAVGPTREAEKERLEEAGWLVYPVEDPVLLFTFTSSLLYSALEAIGQALQPPGSEDFVVIPETSMDSRAYLPLIARFGALNEAYVKRYFEDRHGGYRFNLDLSKLVRVEGIDPSRAPLDLFAGDLRGVVEEGEVENALTLWELTGIGLTPMIRSRSKKVRGVLADRYRPPVIVTGQYDNVEDFALYWNLRAARASADPFPLWLPLNVLEDDDGPQVVEGALSRSKKGWAAPQLSQSEIHIVSASTGTEELEERLREKYPKPRIGSSSLSELFATTCTYRYATEKSAVHFERGRASVRPPRPEALKNFGSYIDHVAYDVRVDGIWLPQGKAIARHMNKFPYQAHETISQRGTRRFVEAFNNRFSETGLLEVDTPDGWGLLTSIFEERGYDIKPSDKATPALGQLSLLGGTDNLRVIASSKVRRLLWKLSLRYGDNQYVAKRISLPFQYFAGELGKSAVRVILRWLVERQVIFRGAVLECPRCTTSEWYPVDSVREIWKCHGCQQDSPIPLKMDKTEWQYRINDLYARGHEQGTLTPLLTLRSMIEAWSDRPDGSSLGFYPGVVLEARKGANVPFAHKEIDLVALHGSNLILAECKESTGHLDKSGDASYFARKLADSVVLADHLGASQLLNASSTSFPKDRSSLLKEVRAGHSVELEWLEGRHLLDPDVFTNPLSFPNALVDPSPGPGREKQYLDTLINALADPTV